jgi:hypothetical protein
MMDEKAKKAVLAFNSVLLDRIKLGQQLGQQYGGKRDLYDALGYPLVISYQQYLGKYQRQDIAGRIVDLPAKDTWRKPPTIMDATSNTAEDTPSSPFVNGLRYLIDRQRLWHYLARIDRLAGIGRFGVLLIGTSGIGALSTEMPRMNRPEDVIYLSPYSEGAVQITKLVDDPTSPRFGLPELYTVNLGIGMSTETVHWSRVIHVADDLLEDEVYGQPRMQRAYNLLEDLLKIIGGGAEATWRNMDKGLHADIRDGFTDVADEDELSDEIDEYMHGLRRFLRTQGITITPLGSDVVDPTGLFNAIIGLVAASSDIPQRILLGSERGELASSQDAATWAGQIFERQQNYAEPQILRALIDRLVAYGALPAPQGGKYTIEWPSQFELTDLERADLALKVAQAAAAMSPGSPEMVIGLDYFQREMLGLPEAEIGTENHLLDEEDGEGVEE